MGVKDGYFEQVCQNIRTMARIKAEMGLECTIGLQMVFMPEFADQAVPLAKLGAELGADYLVIKHCSDDETHHVIFHFHFNFMPFSKIRAVVILIFG